MKETKKVIKQLKEKNFSKGKGKGTDCKKKNHLRKQQDTIVYPPNKPHYCVSGLLMGYPLEKLFE